MRTRHLRDVRPPLPVSRPRLMLSIWAFAVIGLVCLAVNMGGAFEDDMNVDGTQTATGAALIREGQQQPRGVQAQIVLRALDGTLEDHESAVDAAVRELRKTDHVDEVKNPFQTPGAISPDGSTAVVSVELDDEPTSLGEPLLEAVDAAVEPLRDQFEVAYAGQLGAATDPGSGQHRAEAIGLAAALILLLLTFGSVLGALTPLLAAAIALAAGLALLTIASGSITLGTAGPTLASMIGLGAGIDYSLFVVTRARQHLMDGDDARTAAGRALRANGPAVLVAACTVSLALLGLYASGISFVGQLGLAATFTVLTAGIGAVTLVPAVLALMGRRIDRLCVRRPIAEPSSHGTAWYRYAALVSRRPWPFLAGSLSLLGVLTIPLLSIQLGHVDDGARPAGTQERIAYDLIATGFGPGANGTFTVVLDASDLSAPVRDAGRLLETLTSDPGVARATPFVPTEPGATTLISTVTPRTAPMDAETTELFDRLTHELRYDLAGTDGRVYVTGDATGHIEFSERVTSRLPYMIGAVVAASLMILLYTFRSPVLAIKAGLLNLLSIGAAYGVLVAVFQWGWGSEWLGIDRPVPIESFVPMMMFAIVFGLSMDYEVFLLSRIREAWLRSRDTCSSVAEGLSVTARVITCAALIMISVFLAFAASDDVVIKMLAVGLATSVVVDATIVRLILVPAAMAVLGGANWWTPVWLDRLLPSRGPR